MCCALEEVYGAYSVRSVKLPLILCQPVPDGDLKVKLGPI